MRKAIFKWAAAFAVVTATTAPALACGGLFTPCPPRVHAYVPPCAQQSYGYAAYARQPRPVYQYYRVNQGPVFSGPGKFAPHPTYQETAVSRWSDDAIGYDDGYYDGGPYADPINHYSYAQPLHRGPAIYSYPSRARSSYRHAPHRAARHAHAPQRSYAPRYAVAPRYDAAPRGPSSRYGQQPRRDVVARPQVIYGQGHPGPAKRAQQESRRRQPQHEREALPPPRRER